MSFYPGSFLHDELPQGADLVTLVRVAHDHPDEVVKQLLQKIHAALPIGRCACCWPNPWRKPCHRFALGFGAIGCLLSIFICSPWVQVALRTPEELMHLMEEAGFGQIEHLPNAMPIHAQLIVARKSKCLP